MAFSTLTRFITKIVRSPSVDPVTNPQPVTAGTLVISSDMKSYGLVTVGGHLGGDNFEVQYTSGSNLVIIPNNVLVWSGLKLFSPQFPSGVAITGKTANFREYTIASPATVTRKEMSNFAYIRQMDFKNFGAFDGRPTPYNDLNLYRYEGNYYVPTGTTNLPVSGSGYFLDVKQSGQWIIQEAKQNTAEMRTFQRRSADNGATWSAWDEFHRSLLSWTNATLQNSFTNVSGRTVQYALNGNLLHVKGGVNTPSGSSPADATIFIVPSTHYPAQEVFTAIYGAGTGATSASVLRASLKTSGAFVNSFAVTVQILQLDCILTLK